MSFDWADFLKIAESLYNDPLNPGPEEAAYRTAASRAYYAAHKSAVVFGNTETYSTARNRKDHKGIINYFRNHSDKPTDRKKIANWLDRMRYKRGQADYDAVCPNNDPKRLAQSCLALSRNVFDLLDNL